MALSLLLALAAACDDADPAAPAQSPADPTMSIYEAVIQHMAAEEGQESGYPVIYVLDRVVPDADAPEASDGEGAPFSEDLKSGLTSALEETGIVEFISDRESVIGPDQKGARVRNGGILLTLGPIEGDGDRVEVPASSYLGNLAASWQTWVVERDGTVWHVTGTTGPVAVS